MKADFSKFVGRDPAPPLNDLLPDSYNWRQLHDADPATAEHIRHELAKRKVRQRSEELSDVSV